MFSLAPYRISVHADGAEKPLWADDEKQGFAPWFFEYMEALLGTLQPQPERRLARVARLCRNSDQTLIFGRYQTGEYGFKSELVDTEANAVSHVRRITEAEMIPFFYMLAVPKQASWAVLILEKFKNFGIRDYIIPRLINDFEATHKGCQLRVHRLVPGTLASTILDGALIKSMRFVSYKLPAGVEDAFGVAGMSERVHEVEFVVRAARGKLLPKLEAFKDVLLGKKNVGQIMTLPNLPYDTIKLDLEFNGRRRTMDIAKPFKISPNVDITDQVSEDDDGHPVWEEVIEAARDFACDLLSAQGVEIQLSAEIDVDLVAEDMPELTITETGDPFPNAAATVEELPPQQASWPTGVAGGA